MTLINYTYIRIKLENEITETFTDLIKAQSKLKNVSADIVVDVTQATAIEQIQELSKSIKTLYDKIDVFRKIIEPDEFADIVKQKQTSPSVAVPINFSLSRKED